MSGAGRIMRRGAGAAVRAIGLGPVEAPGDGRARIVEGAVLMTAATFFLAASNAMVRGLAPEVHPFVAGFALNLIGLMTVWPWIRREGWRAMRMKAPRLHAVRGLIGVLTLMAWMWALAEVELAKATALSFTAPIFAAAAAILWLGEKATRARLAGLAAGFVGALVILRPGLLTVDLGTVIALLAAAGMAAMYVTTKMLLKHETPASVIVNTALIMTPLSLVAAIPVLSMPPASAWPLLLAMGLAGTLGRILLTRALNVADATSVMPFDFGRLIFISIMGAAFFAETPDLWTVVGSVVIAVAAVLATRSDARAAAAAPPFPADGVPAPCSRTDRP